MRTAALHNLGCKVNSYETEAMQQLLPSVYWVFCWPDGVVTANIH